MTRLEQQLAWEPHPVRTSGIATEQSWFGGPVTGSLSLLFFFIIFLYFIVHIWQNESVPQDSLARARRVPVPMAPEDGSLLFHEKTSEEEFVLLH